MTARILLILLLMQASVIVAIATSPKEEVFAMQGDGENVDLQNNEMKKTPSNEQKDDLTTAKYWAQALASRLKVTGYAQAAYTATMPQGEENTNTFDMKRVILMVAADITPHFYAFFMHDFKSGTLQEYYMEYRACKGFNIRFGQSKIELSMENPMSPSVLESIGPMSQGVFWLCGSDPLISNTCGRDIGLMFYGDLFKQKLHYVVEILNGGQVNTADKNEEKNIIAKLEYRPSGHFRVSVSGQKGYGYALTTSQYNSTVKEGTTYRQDRCAVGMEWKSKETGTDYYKNRCVTLRSEFLAGRDGKCNSLGAYVSSAIPVYKELDVVAMVDFFNYNTDLKLKKANFTTGVQYWLFKKCRLQLQYTYSLKSKTMKTLDGNDYNMLQAQVQVAF